MMSKILMLEENLALAKADLREAKEQLSRSVTWSINDFVSRASSICETGDWFDEFSEPKMERALKLMIEKHDAEFGITWETVDSYLETYCRKK